LAAFKKKKQTQSNLKLTNGMRGTGKTNSLKQCRSGGELNVNESDFETYKLNIIQNALPIFWAHNLVSTLDGPV
jgi:hypothetical protein